MVSARPPASSRRYTRKTESSQAARLTGAWVKAWISRRWAPAIRVATTTPNGTPTSTTWSASIYTRACELSSSRMTRCAGKNTMARKLNHHTPGIVISRRLKRRAGPWSRRAESTTDATESHQAAGTAGTAVVMSVASATPKTAGPATLLRAKPRDFTRVRDHPFSP